MNDSREREPSPLVGEGREGGAGGVSSGEGAAVTPAPGPAPQGGGETCCYRDAVEADAEALAEFAQRSWLATFGHLPYPRDDLAAYLQKSYGAEIQRAEIADPEVRYHLALRDGAIVGYCMMGVVAMPVEDAGGLELHRLYVDESVKGAGVADALMADAVAWARERAATALYLSVWEKNERAQRFYRRHGFADHGEWEFMVGATADRDLIWRLAL